MQHRIPLADLGPHGADMATAVSACVHCGFCLPACPTYRLLGEEMDSPRGRIFLMKDVLEGALPLESAAPYIDRCLGCVACVPACPSGVPYGDLLMAFRSHTSAQRQRSVQERATRLLISQTLSYPDRFRRAISAGKLGKRLGSRLPSQVAAMVELIPSELPKAPPPPLGRVIPAQGVRRARVALLVGCVQQVLAPDINWATLRVLSHNGIEVEIPAGQGCCGALALHVGELAQAQDLARTILKTFPRDVDAIITDAAGCGSGIKDYGLLFRGEAEEAIATEVAGLVRDASAFLAELGWLTPPPLPEPMVMAYHDPCHLAHAQGVREAPRRLLSSIPNLTLAEIEESDLCCGSAGAYNIEQPELATRLGQRKAQRVLASGAQALATGNIGCLTQIQKHLQAAGKPLPLYHTMQVLDWAYATAP